MSDSRSSGLSADEVETVKKALSIREGLVVKSAVEQARMVSVKACPQSRNIRFVNVLLSIKCPPGQLML